MGDHSRQLIKDLEEKTRLFRREILEMTFKAGSGHPGGSLSAVDIITVLYYHQMRVDPKNPKWADRDRFVLSKGHVCPALYAILAEIGFFPKEALWTLRRPESILQGHPDMRLTPGVEMSTGSLGQGLSVACGMALAARLDEKDYAVYCMLGDGEVQEGNVWEGAMFASHERLDNLIAILDRNRLQIEGFTDDVMTLDPLEDKWKAFGWTVLELEDGNDIKQILTVLDKAVERQGKPKIIIANTIKGKGVSFMENRAEYHGRALSPDEMKRARQELEIPGFKVD
ncbi:transketolase [Candidatus Bathyarchaeota archaeon]|nr:MAG: transketolase [Candidatus Bathyarchaeota archaeon]